MIFKPKAMFSAIFMWVNRAYFWNTVFNWRLFGGSLLMSTPSKMTLPVSAVSKPPMMRRVVVLPQPLGPSRVTKEFSFTERLRSSKTMVLSKLFEILTRSIRGCAIAVFLLK